MTGSSSDERGASEAASLVFRIATVGLSLASAIMTATATQCLYDDAGQTAGNVSYRDYPSFRYAAVADLLSAVLQGVAIYLEAAGKKKAAKTVELIDKLVLALASTSTALLLAVDEITSCGPPGARRGRRGRPRSACDQAGAFCGRLRVSSALSLAGAVSVSVSVYTRRAPEAVPSVNVTAIPVRRRLPAPAPSPPRGPGVDPPPPPSPKSPDPPQKSPPKSPEISSKPPPSSVSDCKGKPPKGQPPCHPPPPTGCSTDNAPAMAVVPPWCRCPRLTIPCRCENPELCNAFF